MKWFKIASMVFLIFIVLGVGACSSKGKTSLPVQDVTVFKGGSCGCCGVYSQYLGRQGLTVENIDMPDISVAKNQFNIPSAMESCHTTQIGDYFVEGHIPTEAMEKLMSEKPDIAGIAMPGMPSGSPGMPGAKQGPFVIYAIDKDGSITEFMRI